MKNIFKFVGCCFFSFMILACSSANQTASMPEEFTVSEVSMYLGRASLHSLDFEQYKLTGKKLFQECGVIRRGRHIPTHQQLFDLTDGQHYKLMQQVWDILELAHSGNAQLEEPGTTDTMFDPGRLFLTIKGNEQKLKLKTALDTISDPTTTIEDNLNETARLIRSLAKPGACGNPSFYGLGFEG